MKTISMKCQILFSGENKKNIINLLSAELAKRVVKINLSILQTAVHLLQYFAILYNWTFNT